MSSPPSSGASARSAASNGPAEPTRLELYARCDTEAGRLARQNVERLHAQHFAGAFELAVFDLDRSPVAAQSARILLTPALILRGPAGERRCFGDFADAGQVRRALGLESAP